MAASPQTTTVDTLVAKVFALPSANPDPSKWSLDVVLQVAVELAGLVKNAASPSATKQQNFELLLQVVNAVLDQLQAKELKALSSLPQGSYTDTSVVNQRWASLKAVVNTTLPVVFSYTSHLSVPPAVASCFSCFVADVVAGEEKVVALLPAVESVVASALPVVDELAAASGNTAVSAAVEKVEADVTKVENTVNVVAGLPPVPPSSDAPVVAASPQ